MSQFYQQLQTLTPEQRALFEKKMAQKGLQSLPPRSIPARPSDDQPLPLSFAQQRLWFMQQLNPNNTAYNVASALKLQGALEVAALEKSLSALVARHETLRTHFELIIDAEGNSQPVQKVNLAESVQLVREDLRVGLGSDSELGTGSGSVSGSVSESNLEVIAKQRIQSITQTPFDLSKPLLRTALLQVSENSHYLVIATHHIISDRWSVMVFLREMTLLYRAFSTEPSLTVAETPAILSPLPIQYADWAIWQRQQLQGDKLKQQTDYWTRQLSGELPVLALPTDRPYRATASYQGAQVPLALSAELSEQLKGLSSQYGVTLFTLLLTAFNVLLHRYTQSDDIVVGSDIANRDRIETEGLIGLLVNTLVFRNDLSNNPRFCDCLQQVRRTVLDGLAHQDLPFEKLVEVINPERHLSQMMPLFQVKLDLQQVDVKPMQLDGLSISRHPLPETQAKYELRFNLQDTPEGIAGQVEYNCDLFDESTITRMIGHFNTLLSGIVSAPESELSALPLLSEKEHRTMLIDWNQTQKDYPNNLCIHQLFEAQAKKTPDAIALDDGHTTLTYSQLNDQANRIAHFLKDLGIGDSTGERIGETTQSIQAVGICMYRCCEMVAGLLGILKAGGTYVPLDPAYPAERLSFIVEDADIQVLLTKRENLTDENGIEETSIFSTFQSVQAVDIAEVLQHSPDDLSDLTATHITPSDLAYVIYTSGSTGKPKGVAIEHRSTVALLHWAREQFSTAELSGVLASTSICFDLSVFEIFAPLSWGGCAIVVENALALPTLPSATKVRLLNTVPSILSQLLKTSELPDSIQTVNLAGEVLPISLVKQLQQHEHITHIYNLYGPSEDTTYSTCASLHRDALTNSWDQDDLHQSDSHKESPSSAYSRVSIGKPVANTQAYVLDHFQQPVPIGVVGELYLSGDGLAQGYLHRPELTAERFVAAGSLVIASSLTTSSLTVNEASNQAASSTIKDARVYKTGDRVRYLPDGSLEFLGRFDDQVKIRGFRIETGEIEAVLNQQPSVQSAIVVAHSSKAAHSEDERLEKQLVAYIIPAVSSKHPHVSDLSEPNSEHRLSEQLRQALAKQLPDYLIPTQWVELDKLPRLPNGKINRRALPAPDRQSKAAYTAPRSELEKAITTIWRDVLGQEKVGIYDNFFELGGHSLLAIQIVTQIEMTLHQKIALQTFFQSPTVLGLAQYLEALDDKTTLPQLADEASHKRPQITPDLAQRHQPFPLTDIQQAYWLGRSQAFELGNIGTHGYRELQVSGLSVQQVEQALNRLIERHDMLRAIVNPDGQQQILPQVSRYAIAVTDLRQTDNAQTDNTQTAEAVESTLTAIRDRLSHQ
ncbi:MAG: amino acid adenylation domain-containing protein, partial [Cyanobacteria bacterium J06621_11]